jgi:hypothetical protein
MIEHKPIRLLVRLNCNVGEVWQTPDFQVVRISDVVLPTLFVHADHEAVVANSDSSYKRGVLVDEQG